MKPAYIQQAENPKPEVTSERFPVFELGVSANLGFTVPCHLPGGQLPNQGGHALV